MRPDWTEKVEFMRKVGATKASFAADGSLESIELGVSPEEESSDTQLQPVFEDPRDPEVRRKIALGAVGGLRRVRQ